MITCFCSASSAEKSRLNYFDDVAGKLLHRRLQTFWSNGGCILGNRWPKLGEKPSTPL
jgi:hypothetical protein